MIHYNIHVIYLAFLFLPSSGARPCSTCQIPYSFRHVISLGNDSDRFDVRERDRERKSKQLLSVKEDIIQNSMLSDSLPTLRRIESVDHKQTTHKMHAHTITHTHTHYRITYSIYLHYTYLKLAFLLQKQ